ncbi:Bgt-5359, partial [Blumeria graminis f. sp. tritici]
SLCGLVLPRFWQGLHPLPSVGFDVAFFNLKNTRMNLWHFEHIRDIIVGKTWSSGCKALFR